MKGCIAISRRDFYAAGGFAHPNQFRKMRSGAWCYYRIIY
jgi:hypothetical protein